MLRLDAKRQCGFTPALSGKVRGFTQSVKMRVAPRARIKDTTCISTAGFTLLETLVYIGLFSLIMVGALIGAFQIIDSSVATRWQTQLEQEAHFIFRKIDWALNGGVNNVSAPGNNRLEVDKQGGDDFDFWVDDGALVLNGVGTPLTSSGIEVTNFFVEIIPSVPPPGPEGVRVTFELDGREFASSVRYVR